MDSTQQPAEEVRKDYMFYKKQRAKPGMAGLKAEYLEAFRSAESSVMHFTIMCSGVSPPAEWVEKKDGFIAEREQFRALLEEVIK